MKEWLGTLAAIALAAAPLPAQSRTATPIRQSGLSAETAATRRLTLRDVSRNDRWLGLGVRDLKWAPDGTDLYFRWNLHPQPNDLAAADPWFRTDRRGRWVEEVPATEVGQIPTGPVSWARDGHRATWVGTGGIYLYDQEARSAVERVVSLPKQARRVRMTDDGSAIDFEIDDALYRYQISGGSLLVVAMKVAVKPKDETDEAKWLAAQQRELFEHVRRQHEQQQEAAEINRRFNPSRPQPIPVPASLIVDNIQLSPDGKYVTFRTRKRDTRRPVTKYMDYLDDSGYSGVRDARPKVGEPRDIVRLGIVPFDPTVEAESVTVRWIDLPEAGDRHTVAHGPYWSLEGDRAVVQFIGEDHQDIWFAEVDLETGHTRVLAHDHDDAWIGGPPIQANYLQPALLQWLPGDRFVFASERSGWSHLYLMESDGSIRPLTRGNWEVRGATLSRDRTTWLLKTSREHPSEDHLYLMPAAGGELLRLTHSPGAHSGQLSPDGKRFADIYSESTHMPDLFIGRATAKTELRRVTVSGTDNYLSHPLVQPEIVSFDHPDGGPLWAALFKPARPNPEHAAVIHVHGGGYRQFAHRGWTVYGYALHLGLINYLVQQGYTVLDFDYRGSAGYGRDYRTDIARSMGINDVDGAVAAANYLVTQQGIDSTRIGIYGVSYGGFMTLMSLFRYPGIFAAGVARGSVSDWAQYSDGWTSRILGVPYKDPAAYKRSSPIYYAEGLQDHLLLTHGLVDNNVHFQDDARLVQRLIELGKEFDVMYYPAEPHTIQTEPSRYDYVRRATKFFDRYLLRR
ncbi:MAG: prolyl oligopeptidase family serine peptidase [Gemmatimonadales bacterium]